jgi:nucleoporin NUP82
MPKIKSYAPSWLNEPSPGHKLFEQSGDDGRPSPTPYGKKPKPGPRRTIAHRGTEVFVAVGKQIRWGDLAYLKESWETKQHARSTSGTRIKREPSDDSFEFGDGAAGGGMEGYRVSAKRR